MLRSHQHSPERKNRYHQQNTISNIFRKTLLSVQQRKQINKVFEPMLYNIRSKEAKVYQLIQKSREKQFLSVSYQPPQAKSLQKRKQILNKTFNRTKTDFAHNFVGRKYIVQVQEQRKKPSVVEAAPFKRNCHRHQNPPSPLIRHHISHQNIGEVIKKTDDKKQKLKSFSNNDSKRYQKFLKLKKKAYPIRVEKTEKDKNFEKSIHREQQLHNTEIAPWESLGNNSSWFNPY